MGTKITCKIFSLLVMIIVFGFGQDVFAGTIQVDKNNGGCVNASGQPSPYTVVYCQVAHAVTDATSGDTINVAYGAGYTPYLENTITINKSLTLKTTQGAEICKKSGSSCVGFTLYGTNLILLQAPSPGVTLSDVTIDGFTITNSNIDINNNCSQTNQLTITNLTVKNIQATGGIIAFNGAIVNNFTIEDATFDDIDVAVGASSSVPDSDCPYTEINGLSVTDSVFTNNYSHAFYYVKANLTNATFQNLTIRESGFAGMTMQSGNYTNVTIADATFEGNGWRNTARTADGGGISFAIWALANTISGLTIDNVNFTNNEYGSGIEVISTTVSNSSVLNSSFTGNDDSGISFSSGTTSAVTVQSSTFQNNSRDQIAIGISSVGNLSVSDMTVNGNTFVYPPQNSIWIDTTANFIDNEVVVSDNNFSTATQYLRNNITKTVDARNNWWASISGPTHSSNPTGVGATVTDYVTYTPWCVSPSAPGTPTTTTPTNETTPTWTWTAAVRCGLSLAAVPYTVEWCQDAGFSDCEVNSSTSATNSFTHSVELSRGLWYVRVKAKDTLNNESGYSTIGLVYINGAPEAPTLLGPSGLVNGSFTASSAPAFSFTLSDSDNSDTVKYQIQIDDNADFGSPVVDYTSSLASQGSASFSVGQSAGSGSYTVGSTGQTLAEGNYYWRVKTIDNGELSSSFSTANSGNIAFKTDLTAPSTPATPVVVSSLNDRAPHWEWTASTDSLSGVNSYIASWCKNSEFSGCDSNTDVTVTNSYSHSTALDIDTWYFRVKALDTAGNLSANSTIAAVSLVGMISPPASGFDQISSLVSGIKPVSSAQAPLPTPTATSTLPVPEDQLTLDQLEAQIIELTRKITKLREWFNQLFGKTIDGIPTNYRFNKILRLGDSSSDVRYLQIFLSQFEKEIYPSGLITGYFGRLTHEGVVKFQEKYSAEILAPLGLERGTAIVSGMTNKKINSLLGR